MEEAGAFIWKDGILVPDLDDEAMAGRHQPAPVEPKTKKAPTAEVSNAEK